MTPWIKRRAGVAVIRCLACMRPLARIETHDGRTCIRVGGSFATMARLVCACGGVREFSSRKV